MQNVPLGHIWSTVSNVSVLAFLASLLDFCVDEEFLLANFQETIRCDPVVIEMPLDVMQM